MLNSTRKTLRAGDSRKYYNTSLPYWPLLEQKLKSDLFGKRKKKGKEGHQYRSIERSKGNKKQKEKRESPKVNRRKQKEKENFFMLI